MRDSVDTGLIEICIVLADLFTFERGGSVVERRTLESEVGQRLGVLRLVRGWGF